MRRKWHGRIFREKNFFYKKFEKTWFFEAFFGFISETALRNSVKLGQKVVHIVPEHLQKTAQQNLFPFSRYSSSKMAFFGIFRSRKKKFLPEIFFFHFSNLHPSIRENQQKKILTWKISHSEVTQVWHLKKNLFGNFFFSKSLDLFIIDTRNNVYLIAQELPQEPTYFDCIGKSPTMGHDSDDGDLIREVIMLKVKHLWRSWPRGCNGALATVLLNIAVGKLIISYTHWGI